jgi:hypothetical protein
VSITCLDGYRIAGALMIGGRDAALKAQAVGEAIFKRTRNLFKILGMKDFEETNIEVIGAEHSKTFNLFSISFSHTVIFYYYDFDSRILSMNVGYGPHSRARNSREVLLRLSARHSSDKALGIFAKECAPAVLPWLQVLIQIYSK